MRMWALGLLCILVGPIIAIPIAFADTPAPLPLPATSPAPIRPRDVLYNYNRSAPLDIKEVSVEQHGDVAVHDISFAAARGGRTTAYLVVPPGKGPFASVLWVHWLGPPQVANRTEFLSEAIELAKSGVVSLLVDALWAAPNKFPWTGQDEVKDRATSVRQVIELQRAIDVLLAQPNVDAKRMGYVGHDFGAMSGGELSGVEQRIKAYVLIAGSPRYAYWFFNWSPLKGPARDAYAKKMDAVDPINFVKKAAPAALYFQFGKGKDDWCPDKQSQEYFDVASEPKRISWYDCGHAIDAPEAARDRNEWICEQLGIQFKHP